MLAQEERPLPMNVGYSEFARKILSDDFVSFLGREAKARDHRGEKYQNILDPFVIDRTFGGYQEKGVQHLPYHDTHEAVVSLSQSLDPDKRRLGNILYARLANGVRRTLAFVGLVTGDQKQVENYLAAIPMANDEIIANTSQPPFSYLQDHLFNMAESIAASAETATINYNLPCALNNVSGSRTFGLEGQMTFSVNGIQTDISLPTIQGRHDELVSCPTNGFLRDYVDIRHTLDPTSESKLLAEIEKLKTSGDAQDKIRAEIIQAQYDLRHTSAAIASETCSPTDAQMIAQLAIRAGYTDYLPEIKDDAQTPLRGIAAIKEKARGASIQGAVKWATTEQARPRGPFKTKDEVNQIIATGLLKWMIDRGLGARLNDNRNFTLSFIESAGELTLNGKNGEMYTVSAKDGKLNVRYQNPTLFKTNPGEYWTQAINRINDIYRSIYEFYGLDTRTVKLEVPAQYKEVHIANLELIDPDKCKGRSLEWIGGYERDTMDKIFAAEKAVLQHFESDASRLDTAPNMIMDGTTGSGKTFVSEALMVSFKEKLGPKGVATYRLTTTEQMTAQEIILDLRSWSRMKGKSILLVEDLFQKTRLLKPEDAAAVLTTLNDVAKKIADSRDKVLLLNTEYLAETTKGAQAITQPHRFPFFMEFKLDHSPAGLEDAFRGIVTKLLDKQIPGIKKGAPEVDRIMQQLSSLRPDAKQSLWEAIIILPNSQVLSPGVLNDVLSVKAISQRDGDLEKVDGALILELMPKAIKDELARKEKADKALGLDLRATVEKIWEALQPLVELGQGNLKEGVGVVIAMLRRHQDDQKGIAAMLLGKPELWDPEALTMLKDIVEGNATVPPAEENT